jgi:hypothetical protein
VSQLLSSLSAGTADTSEQAWHACSLPYLQSAGVEDEAARKAVAQVLRAVRKIVESDGQEEEEVSRAVTPGSSLPPLLSPLPLP